MGSQICSKYTQSYDSVEVQSLYTRSDEEYLLTKFNEISNNPMIVDLERKLGAFEFTYNYYFDLVNNKLSTVSINFEDVEVTKNHSVVSPLIGKDDEGTWVYIGECLLGTSTKDGRGFLVHLDKKCKFQGYFHNGSPNGRGRFVSLEKLQEGDWLNDEIIGEGREITKDFAVYTGKFQGRLYENLGKIIFSDRSSYSGEFVKGERHGYGEYQWPDNSRYIGNWKSGKFSGIGKYIDVQGNIFEGGWKENQMDGYGEYVWRDGRKYRGNYYNGKKHGYGEMYWPDGNSWRGSWKNGKQHGKGEAILNGSKKTGMWYDGKFISWNE